MSDEPRCGVESEERPGVRCVWPLGHEPAWQHGARDGDHYFVWSTGAPPEE